MQVLQLDLTIVLRSNRELDCLKSKSRERQDLVRIECFKGVKDVPLNTEALQSYVNAGELCLAILLASVAYMLVTAGFHS